ncbi:MULTISPECIES: hypothetical protein [Paenibacillus]|nr:MULTISPECIES: hypothetical protein [Paenibacillus]
MDVRRPLYIEGDEMSYNGIREGAFERLLRAKKLVALYKVKKEGSQNHV